MQIIGSPHSISHADLLDQILGAPVGGELMARFSTFRALSRAEPAELMATKGIGVARSLRLKAAFELGRRMLTEPSEELPLVRSPGEAAGLLVDMCALEQEEMRVLLLDTRGRVTAMRTVYVGNLNSTVVRVGELFREAVRHNAAAIILAHNHPSNDPTPSPEDVRVTEAIVKAGRLLDIDVLDHLVIGGPERFVSLKERGLGFGGAA